MPRAAHALSAEQFDVAAYCHKYPFLAGMPSHEFQLQVETQP
jgi:hypothetical protein